MCCSGWRGLADYFLRAYGQHLHLLVITFIVSLIAAAKQDKIKLLEKRRIMADKRQGLSICQFARQFNPRTVDTCIIQAVWNTLQENGYIGYPLPLKADDKLDEDLDLVNDAVELEELVEDIAARCGRDLTGIENNQFLPIVTVGSLVKGAKCTTNDARAT